jgi:L-lactate dehydrogenase complex protein LldG
VADARSDILAAVRAANNGRPAPEPISRQYQRFSTHPDIVGLLAERVADYQATVHRCGATEIAATIATITARRDVRKLVVPTDLPDEWVPASLGRIHEPLTVAELDTAPGVLTGCAVAIADTGTIVLDSGAAQGRRALTLVPDYHLITLTGSVVRQTRCLVAAGG